jgi:hypothetical protein
MTDNLQNTINHILEIKEDLREALASRDVDVTGVPFRLWASRMQTALANRALIDQAGGSNNTFGPVFGGNTSAPTIPPYRPQTLPSTSQPVTLSSADLSGMMIGSIGFEYGALSFDFTGEVGSVGNGSSPETLYDGPLFTDPAPHSSARRMGWMDAVDSNPNGIWVSWLLWSYSGTGSPPYTDTIGVYRDEARTNFLTTAVYSNGKFYSLTDISTYTTQGGSVMSAGLIKLGLHAPIVDLEARYGENIVSPNWDAYPVYCYGGLFEMWNGERINCDSAERCAIVTLPESLPEEDSPPPPPPPPPSVREEWISYDYLWGPLGHVYIGGAGWTNNSYDIGKQFVWNGENAVVIDRRLDQAADAHTGATLKTSILARIG